MIRMKKRYMDVSSRLLRFRTGRGRLVNLTDQSPRTVVIDRRFRIRLPWNLPSWHTGRRVFWKARGKEVVLSLSPKGMVSKGRYVSGRVRELKRRK